MEIQKQKKQIIKAKKAPEQVKQENTFKSKNEDYKIEDEKLRETIEFVKSRNLVKLNPNIKFDNYIEAENYFKEELGNFLTDKYNDVHEQVSEIRKEGKEATVITFKLMMIPLKIKIFLATCEKKDFEKVLNMIEEVKNETPPSTKQD